MGIVVTRVFVAFKEIRNPEQLRSPTAARGTTGEAFTVSASRGRAGRHPQRQDHSRRRNLSLVKSSDDSHRENPKMSSAVGENEDESFL